MRINNALNRQTRRLCGASCFAEPISEFTSATQRTFTCLMRCAKPSQNPHCTALSRQRKNLVLPHLPHAPVEAFHQKTPAIPHIPPNSTCRFHVFHASKSTQVIDSTLFHLSLRTKPLLNVQARDFHACTQPFPNASDLHETRMVPCLYREPIFFSQSTFAPLWHSSDAQNPIQY